MTRMTAVLLTFVGIFASSEVDAQLFSRKAGHQTMPGQVFASSPTPRSYSYSYYSRSSLPARTYVGYGNNDFPYHGAPYGHPYDPYTWATMSSSYQSEMARYYAPPLK